MANTTAMDVEIRKGRNNEQYIYKVPRSVSKYFLIKDGNKSQMTRGPCRDHINQVSNHPPRPKYSGMVDGRTDPGSSSSGLLWRAHKAVCVTQEKTLLWSSWLALLKSAQVANGCGRLEKTSQDQRNRKGTVISAGWEPLLDQGALVRKGRRRLTVQRWC